MPPYTGALFLYRPPLRQSAAGWIRRPQRLPCSTSLPNLPPRDSAMPWRGRQRRSPLSVISFKSATPKQAKSRCAVCTGRLPVSSSLLAHSGNSSNADGRAKPRFVATAVCPLFSLGPNSQVRECRAAVSGDRCCMKVHRSRFRIDRLNVAVGGVAVSLDIAPCHSV
jgi:hypothetical protein